MRDYLSSDNPPEGEVVTGDVYNEDGDFLATFTYRHSQNAQELTFQSINNLITFGHVEDGVSVQDYAHREDDSLYRGTSG